jgi:Na+-driven multidrug efflux pump
MQNATAAIAAYSIYYRVVMFAINPIIAASVALLPFSAKRIGEHDIAGLRHGLREVGVVSVIYTLGIVGPAMFFAGPTLARWLAETPLSAEYATFALRLVPLATLVSAPFLLVRPVFEGMGRGKPGLAMASIRYLGLTLPIAWVGIRTAAGMGQPQLYGLMIGLMLVAAITSGIFAGWLRAALQAMERQFAAE